MRPVRKNMKQCRLFFILYFIIIAIFPYSHSHADSEPYLVFFDGPVYSSEHGDFCIPDIRHDEHYADSHSSHDDHHLHFLAEDSNSASRPTVSENKAQLKHIAIPETVIVQSSKQSVIAIIQDHSRSYHAGFYSPYSGLSPPSCWRHHSRAGYFQLLNVHLFLIREDYAAENILSGFLPDADPLEGFRAGTVREAYL